MSLLTNLQSFITAVGGTVKDIRNSITGVSTDGAAEVGTKLDTTSGNLVGAINELHGELDASVGAAVTSVNGTAGPGAITIGTDDIAEGAANLYYTDARVIAAPITGFTSGAGALAGTDSVLAAIQKLDGNISAIDLTDLIDDGASSTTTTYSSDKITADIAASVAALVDASPAALDTLNELAAALGDDPNFATTINNALALKANIADTYSVTELGPGLDTHDFVADWTAAIA